MNKSNEKHGILYISCGVPGSGKTSWLKVILEQMKF